jgi:hypothetical protein
MFLSRSYVSFTSVRYTRAPGFLWLETGMAGRWRQTTPDELATWLEPVPVPWAFAGGWALDLWAGHTSRTHSDIEITCLRGDLKALVDSLAGFEIVVARNKQLSHWRAGAMPEPPFSLWLRRHGELLWDFEIVSEAHADDAWHYRRDERISRPLDLLFRQTPSGRMVIAPEIQLLYKAKAPRERDIADLHHFWPQLDPAARHWLMQAVAVAHPEALPMLDELERSRYPAGGAISTSS